MNLSIMSREELIEKLKKNMVLCTKSFWIERKDWNTGSRIRTEFNEGEYYTMESNGGEMWIKGDNGEWFDCCDDGFKRCWEKNFE